MMDPEMRAYVQAMADQAVAAGASEEGMEALESYVLATRLYVEHLRAQGLRDPGVLMAQVLGVSGATLHIALVEEG